MDVRLSLPSSPSKFKTPMSSVEFPFFVAPRDTAIHGEPTWDYAFIPFLPPVSGFVSSTSLHSFSVYPSFSHCIFFLSLSLLAPISISLSPLSPPMAPITLRRRKSGIVSAKIALNVLERMAKSIPVFGEQVFQLVKVASDIVGVVEVGSSAQPRI